MNEVPAAGSWAARIRWSAFLATRYLRSGRKDSFVSFLSAVAVGGITLGVAALILALSALNGLQAGLRQEVLRRTPEIEVELGGADAESIQSSIAEIEAVERVSRRLRGYGWVIAAGSARPVEIVGYQGELPEVFPEARDRREGVYVSDRLARRYGLEPGRVVEVASTRSTLTPMGPMPRVRRLKVEETFAHSLLDHQEQIAMPFGEALALLGGSSDHLVVETGDLSYAVTVGEKIRQMVPTGVVVNTWQDLNAPLLLALRLEKRLMFIAVFLIVLVGALALISDLSLIIASRRSEIGILATMGARSASLRSAFLTLGATLAVAGIVAGGLLGVATARVLDRWEVIRLPGDAYLMPHVPFDVSAPDVAWIALLTLVVSLLCCWIGAAKVSALSPVEALRS